MSVEEKRTRMRRLRKIVAGENVYRWARRFLYESRRSQRPQVAPARAEHAA